MVHVDTAQRIAPPPAARPTDRGQRPASARPRSSGGCSPCRARTCPARSGRWDCALRAPPWPTSTPRFHRGEIIRSWPMRGTLHLVAAEDIGWMLGLTAARTMQSLATRHRELGMDEADVRARREDRRRRAGGRRAATRGELFAAFEKAGIGTGGQRGVHLLGRLHQTGCCAWGRCRATIRRWCCSTNGCRDPTAFERDEALSRIRSAVLHQPRAGDHSRLHLVDKASVAGCAGRAGHRSANSWRNWSSTAPATGWRPDCPTGCPGGASAAGVRRVPAGLPGSERRLAAEHAPLIVPGNNGMFLSTIVVDGHGSSESGAARRAGAGIDVTPVTFAAHVAAGDGGFRRAATAYGTLPEPQVTVVDEVPHRARAVPRHDR